jgi:excisionase family DNA binding protein
LTTPLASFTVVYDSMASAATAVKEVSPMNTEKIAYRPEEAARATGLSRDVIFKAIREGTLRSLKVGRARLIPATALHEFLGDVAGGESGSDAS